MKAAIYAGPGASALSVHWKRTYLAAHGWNVVKVGPLDVKAAGFNDCFDLLVIPGGESKYYDAALGDEGYASILNFWRKGVVWGACAGAFYLSRVTHWCVGEPGEIVRSRKNFIFGGTATGPYHRGQMTAPGTTVHLAWPDGQQSYARCFRGPVFTGLNSEDCSLVTYTNRGNACGGVVCAAPDGVGRAVLTGFHPEMDWMTGLGDMIAFWNAKPADWDEGSARTRAKFMDALRPV